MRKLRKLINVLNVSIILFAISFILIGCNEKSNTKINYLEKITNLSSYYASGVLESYHNLGKVDSEFEVYSKGGALKVELKSNNNNQIVVKNKGDVLILMPQLNKSFKIDNSWPNNSSFPYLLESINKDIVNAKNIKEIDDGNNYIIEVDCTIFNGKTNLLEKITIDKDTMLPKEVSIYNKDNTLKTRCVFIKIEINKDIDDSVFDIEKLKPQEEDIKTFSNRTFKMPSYYPSGVSEASCSKLETNSGGIKTSIMKFQSSDSGFTVIQEFANVGKTFDQDVMSGNLEMLLANVGVVSQDSVFMSYNGINYTVLSNNIEIDELIEIITSFLVTEEK